MKHRREAGDPEPDPAITTHDRERAEDAVWGLECLGIVDYRPRWRRLADRLSRDGVRWGVAMVALFAVWVAADHFHHASIAAFAAVALVVMLIASD